MRTARALVVVLLAACARDAVAPPARAALRRTGGSTFELVPSAGQHPFCLAYTVSKSGLTRQLTMSPRNLSFECRAGEPVGRHAFKVPLEDGPVRVLVLFTSQSVNAAAVTQQLLEAPDRRALQVMNLRLPGAAAIDSFEFVPEPDVAAEVGGIVGADGPTGAGADAGPP